MAWSGAKTGCKVWAPSLEERREECGARRRRRRERQRTKVVHLGVSARTAMKFVIRRGVNVL